MQEFLLSNKDPQQDQARNLIMDSEQNGQTVVGDGSVDRRGRIAIKAKTGGWRAAPLIFSTEICERMASLGLQRNLVTYFVNKMNILKPAAANMVSNFIGALYLTPFLGGFMADAYLGRFWAIFVFATIQVFGMVVLTLSAALSSLRPPSCTSSETTCISAHGVQLAVLYVGLYLIALGNGGIKPNVSSFGADQFDEHDSKEWKYMPSFFNWFYFIISIGSLISVTVFVYIQDNVGFAWGFGIPAALMAIAIVIFVVGSFLYRYKLPSGSPLTRIMQVIVAAVRKRNLPLPSNNNTLFEEGVNRDGNTTVKKLPHSSQFMVDGLISAAEFPVDVWLRSSAPRPLTVKGPSRSLVGGQCILALHQLYFLERNHCCSRQIDDRSAGVIIQQQPLNHCQ
ncbi:hypothetical protein GOP47_0022350 [Adiantum capillus-veneris]|uniref:Uncharacterized protein n=1 Tax=Adiantum capillus-veneris TaxID=13818 RepID=A0A9D4Z6R9_ADICA|nr:hypothetical protein GOP47_0022350 [Adiantum capillus-veneris]